MHSLKILNRHQTEPAFGVEEASDEIRNKEKSRAMVAITAMRAGSARWIASTMMCPFVLQQGTLPHIVNEHWVLELHRTLSVSHNDEFPALHGTGDQMLNMQKKSV